MGSAWCFAHFQDAVLGAHTRRPARIVVQVTSSLHRYLYKLTLRKSGPKKEGAPVPSDFNEKRENKGKSRILVQISEMASFYGCVADKVQTTI